MVPRRGPRCFLDCFLTALWLGGILNVRRELVMIVSHENYLSFEMINLSFGLNVAASIAHIAQCFFITYHRNSVTVYMED